MRFEKSLLANEIETNAMIKMPDNYKQWQNNQQFTLETFSPEFNYLLVFMCDL